MQQTPRSRVESHAPEPRIVTRSKPMSRRASLEELRSNNASPLLSVRGVYVRSRSPSPNFANWPRRPLPERPDYGRYEDNYMAFHGAHLSTSFAAFNTREKESIPGPSHPRGRARVLSTASVDDAYVGASHLAGAPPAYGHDGRGAEMGEANDDDDVVVYMIEKRTTATQYVELKRKAGAADLRHHTAAHGGMRNAGIVAPEPRPSYAPHWESGKQHTVKFSPTDTIATFPQFSQEVQRDAGPDSRTVQQNYAGSSFEHLDQEEEEQGKKRNISDNWAKVVKHIFKRFGTPRKAPAPVDDRSSTRSSADNVRPALENPKATSASLFNMRIGGARPPTPGAKSMRAPSIKSTASRNVLVKSRKSHKVNPLSTPETLALTSSARAVEGKIRPPSGSSSQSTTSERPTSWQLPEDLQSECDILYEALQVVKSQKANDWVYKPARGDVNSGGQGSGYVQLERRAY